MPIRPGAASHMASITMSVVIRAVCQVLLVTCARGQVPEVHDIIVQLQLVSRGRKTWIVSYIIVRIISCWVLYSMFSKRESGSNNGSLAWLCPRRCFMMWHRSMC